MQHPPPVRNSPSRNSKDFFFSPFVKSGFGISPIRSYVLFSLLIVFIVGAFISTRLLDPTVLIKKETATKPKTHTISLKYPRPTTLITQKPLDFTLQCSAANETTGNKYPATVSFDHSPKATCPDYFRWIHEDLRPWAKTGITREALERAKTTANFRLAIIDGKIYIEKFQDAFQTRDVFTIWGFLQLLRKYPGKIPDLELMFDCVDWPVIRSEKFVGAKAPSPPPLFRYCGNDETLDIVFPDWSFWGW